MKRLLVVAACLASPSLASAQLLAGPALSGNFGGVLTINGNERDRADAFPPPLNHADPALEAIRLDQALALRREAFALQAADGGTLSATHKRYINRKAMAILRR